MKTHYITEISEEFNYILSCGLRYNDSDNMSFAENINEVTCDKCLEKVKLKGER